jgi:hypothetical protein
MANDGKVRSRAEESRLRVRKAREEGLHDHQHNRDGDG